MKTLKLNVVERLLLPGMLPQQGGKIEMLLCNSITEKIDFTADEVSEFGLKDTGGNVTWTNCGFAKREWGTCRSEHGY